MFSTRANTKENRMGTMMTESPLVLVSIGFAVTSCLLVFWFQTQAKWLVPFMIAGAVMTVLPIITATLIETKNEQIKRYVYQMANCVRQNDVAGLLRFVDPEARNVSMQIERVMKSYEFSACNVAGFQSVEFDPDDPDQVTMTFNVFINVNAQQSYYDGPELHGVELKFRRQANDNWLVNGFRHFEPTILQQVPY